MKIDPASAPVIHDHGDLVAFVERMRNELVDGGKNWQNVELSEFLEAMAAWLTDMPGYYQNTGQEFPSAPSWQTFAEILMGARLYE